MEEKTGLIDRLQRYSQKCLADRLDADFSLAVMEAVEILRGLDGGLYAADKEKENA